MFSQYRKIGAHSIFIRQLSALEFECIIDGGQPVYFQPHRPITLFDVLDKAINAASMQMSFEGINNHE